MTVPRSIHFILTSFMKMLILSVTHGLPAGHITNNAELRLEPLEAIVHSSENITFTCSYPQNVNFTWDFNDAIRLYKIVKGMTDDVDGKNYWSQLSVPSVKRDMSGQIACAIESGNKVIEAFLIVNGVQIGGSCVVEKDCITDKASCQNGICSCPPDEVLMKFTKTGYEVCKKMIYRLYDPCEFSEQCFHLVDSKSVCDKNKVCACAAWATDVNGKCVSKGEATYKTPTQELYRVGLVAITCLIIIIVAVSLWITLRRSCQIEVIDAQMHSITQSDGQNSDDIALEIAEDKPPSYDDLESNDTITAPPNFKEALTSSVTAKKFLRQSSAPAGQLICTAVINHRPR